MSLILFSATSIFSFQPVKADVGIIYIKSDGSIDPPSAPISTPDGIIYQLNSDISDSISVEKDGIILDGLSHKIIGTSDYAIAASYRTNVVIKNFEISGFAHGISLWSSTGCTVSNNILSGNYLRGILLHYSSNNYIINNMITDTVWDGIWLRESSSYNIVSGNTFERNHNTAIDVSLSSNYNQIYENYILNNNIGIEWGVNPAYDCVIYHNNFIGNTKQISFNAPASHTWDGGYPSGGNYWSDYTGKDQYQGMAQNIKGKDMIGDTVYVIDGLNVDHYPLMTPWTPLPKTINELIIKVNKLSSNGQITNKMVVNSLILNLNIAKIFANKGKMDAAIATLRVFIKIVDTLPTKYVTPTAEYILIESAKNVISHL